MSDYNLTIEDLKEGKKYHREGESRASFTFTRDAYYVRKGDRFKEIKKEPEFEELVCYINWDSKTIFFKRKDGHCEKSANRLDYKVDGGKLFVKKRG